MKLNLNKKNETLLNKDNPSEVNMLNDFLTRIDEVYKNAVGTEDYGEYTEFFDEDGCVIMRMRTISENKTEFSFDGEGGNESYLYETDENHLENN